MTTLGSAVSAKEDYISYSNCQMTLMVGVREMGLV